MYTWITRGRDASVMPGPLEQFDLTLPEGLDEWSDPIRTLVEAAYDAGLKDGVRKGAHQKLRAIKAALEI